MAFSDKNAIFRPHFELEAIARQSVQASREVSCAYFGNIGRNSGYFLHPILLAVHPSVQCSAALPGRRAADDADVTATNDKLIPSVRKKR